MPSPAPRSGLPGAEGRQQSPIRGSASRDRHLSVTISGQARSREKGPAGSKGVKIQSRSFKSISQMSNWLLLPLAGPHGSAAG